MFNEAIQSWDPGVWADLFRKVGARYVVLVTKHHDGFLLWPSKHPHPHKKDYRASRDIVGELAAAVRQRGLRMGYYYSGGLDWSFNSTPITNRNEVYSTIVQTPEFIRYVDAHWRELIDRYQTSLLWNDIGYPLNAPALELFAHYYNTIPDGVINDRFGQVIGVDDAGAEEVVRNPDGVHYDFTTPEYSSYNRITEYKWEATRGIGFSFGYNRAEGPDSYLSAEQAIRMFVDIVSKNGNFLLNVGPMADGAIPELQRRCLEGLGAWLAVNGEAIFETRPWLAADGETEDSIPVRFTQKDGSLYMILLGTPAADQVTVKALQAGDQAVVQLLGHADALPWTQSGDRLAIHLPAKLAPAAAYALKVTPAPRLVK
jgi:alpha-L-fucosidase